jgi:hypothetical protein
MWSHSPSLAMTRRAPVEGSVTCRTSGSAVTCGGGGGAGRAGGRAALGGARRWAGCGAGQPGRRVASMAGGGRICRAERAACHGRARLPWLPSPRQREGPTSCKACSALQGQRRRHPRCPRRPGRRSCGSWPGRRATRAAGPPARRPRWPGRSRLQGAVQACDSVRDSEPGARQRLEQQQALGAAAGARSSSRRGRRASSTLLTGGRRPSGSAAAAPCPPPQAGGPIPPRAAVRARPTPPPTPPHPPTRPALRADPGAAHLPRG